MFCAENNQTPSRKVIISRRRLVMYYSSMQLQWTTPDSLFVPAVRLSAVGCRLSSRWCMYMH